MRPLKPLVSVGYAFQSATGDADWEIAGDDIYHLDGNVGIGTMPGGDLKLEVEGRLAPAWEGEPVRGGKQPSASYRFGDGEENTGFSSPEGDQISVITAGVERMLINYNGNIGIGTSAPGWPFHVATSRSCAGYFTSDSLSSDTHVIHGEFTGSESDDATGVYGYSRPTDNYGIGGYFEGGFKGVIGRVESEGSGDEVDGVLGEAWGGATENRGVYGEAWESTYENYGVMGRGYGGETAYGVYGRAGNATTNWAGYFDGNVKVTGTLSKGGGSFMIDHPLDPENKYLYHSFVESPDMMNVYNGNVILDASGEAAVQLPDYFEALNRDFRYQLTCIGGFAPVYVAEEISGNQFAIAGGEPGMKVSWQVTGIRHDKFAEANRIQVEVDKPADELGKYIHPQAYGLGEEYDIYYEQHKRTEEARLRRGR